VRRIDRRDRHCYDEANIIEKSFLPVTTTAIITELMQFLRGSFKVVQRYSMRLVLSLYRRQSGWAQMIKATAS
jgi:hypothetical protein